MDWPMLDTILGGGLINREGFSVAEKNSTHQ